MSKTVDERVVEMRFNNKQFESGASTSISTLEKLKQSLKLDGASKGLENVNDAAKKVNLSGLGSAIDTVKTKFSALEVMAVTALANITNSVVNTGKKMLSALTIDPIMSGFSEYETQIGAIQTILANTSHNGTTLEEVNRALDELNLYADKTIYNFTEMTRNIGTFTAAGIDLETSVNSIKGIANLAAVSGSTSAQASTAMYQLSQALAAGKVSLMDWNSVVNAGMGGKVFQDALVRTSELLETGAKKAIETAGSFRESLSKEWLTTEVLTETLKQFAGVYSEAELIMQGFSEESAKSIASMAVTAEEAATKVKTFTQLWDTLQESAQSGWTSTWEILVGDFEEAKALLTEVSDVVGNIISETANARNELLGGALSSGWKQLLNQGIQDEAGYMEAIQEVARQNGDTFAKMVEDSDNFADALRKGLSEGVISADTLSEAVYNLKIKMTAMSDEELKTAGYTSEMVSQITDLATGLRNGSISMDEFVTKMTRSSGRENIIQGLWNAAKGLWSVITTIKEAFTDIFPPATSEQIYEITKNFRMFTENLKLSETAAANLKSTFKGLFAILDIIKQAFSAIFKAIKPLFGGFGDLGEGILGFTGGIGDAIVKFDEFLKSSGAFEKAGEAVAKVVEKIVSAFRTLKENIAEKLRTVGIENFGDLLEKIRDRLSELGKGFGDYFSGGIEQVKAFIARLKEMDSFSWENLGTIFQDFKDKVLGYFLQIGDDCESMLDKIRQVFNNLKENIQTRLEEAAKNLDTFSGKVANFLLNIRNKISDNIGLGEILTAGLGVGLIAAVIKISKFIKSLKSIGDGVKDVLDALQKNINADTWEKRSQALKNVGLMFISLAASVWILVEALKNMEGLDADKVWGNVGIIGAIVGGLALIAGLLGKFAPALSAGSLVFLSMAGAVKIIIGVLEDLDSMEFQNLDKSIETMGLIIAGLAGAMLSAVNVKFGTAFGVLALVGALKIFISVFEDFASIDLGTMKTRMASFGLIFAMFNKMLNSTKLSGKYAAKAGVGVLAMSAALILVMVSFKMIAGMDEATLSKCVKAVSAIMAVFSGVVVLSKFAGKYAKQAGEMLLLMSVSLLILAGVIVILSNMKNTEGLKRAVTIIAVLGVVFAGLIAVTGLAKNCKSNLIVMAVTIGILALAIGTLSMINSDNLITATAAMSAVIIAFALLVASTGLAKSATGTLIVLTLVVAALGAIIYGLSGLPAKGALSAAGALSLLLISLSASLVIISKAGKISSDAYAAIGVLVIAVAGLAVVLGVLGSMNIGPTLEIAASLSLLLLSLSASLVIISKAGKISSDAYAAIGVLVIAVAGLAVVLGVLGSMNIGPTLEIAASLSLLLLSLSASLVIISKAGSVAPSAYASLAVLVLVVAGLGAILGVLASLNLGPTLEIAISLSVLLLSLSAVCAILTLVGLGGPAAFIGIAALATLIAGIGAIMAAIGGLVTAIPEMEEFITKAIPILEQIGTGIGTFLGSIVSSAMEKIADSLPGIGMKLSLFMVSMQPFILGASSIPSTMLAGVTSMVEAILLLTAAELLNGVASWLTGGSSLENFMKQLVPFGEGIADFGRAIDRVDPVKVAKGASAGKILAEMAAALPNSGGVVSWFTGENDMKQFKDSIPDFGKAIAGFARAIDRVDLSKIQKGASAGKTIAEMAATLPNSGGWLGGIMGENDMEQFKDSIPDFGEAIEGFARAVDRVDPSKVEKGASAGQTIAEMAATLPNSGGILGDIVGDNDMAQFKTSLPDFGEAIQGFSRAVDRIDPSKVEKGTQAGKLIAEMAATLPNSGGWFGDVFGDNDLDTFGEQLGKFGKGLSTFYENVTLINNDTMEATLASFSTLVELTQDLQTVDQSVLSNFAIGLSTLSSESINGFVEAFTNSGDNAETAVTTFITAYTTAIDNQKEGLKLKFQELADDILGVFKSEDGEFNLTGQTMVISLITGINLQDTPIRTTITNLISGCLAILRGKYYELESIGSMFVTKLIAGIKKKNRAIKDAFTAMISSCLTAIRSYYSAFASAGEYLVSGFSRGIENMIETAAAAAAKMAMTAAQAAEEALQIKSPSRVGYRIGAYFGMGFVNSITDYADKSYSASATMADSAKQGLRDTISKIGEIVDNGIDSQPVIRPILDLSEVQSGAGRLSAILSRNQAMSISSNREQAYASTIQNGENATPASTNFTFTQNNYSPKALSRIDIYRQTRNQFSALEGLVTR